MRIAVTGGAGFIGSHLSDALSAEGHDVVVLDDLSSGRKENIGKGIKLIRKNVKKDLSGALNCIDALFHLAAAPDVRESAGDPWKSFESNTRGTLSVLESCRKADVGRIVFASSSAVCGDMVAVPTVEDAPCRPISNYGASKAAGESYLSAYSGSYGMCCTSLRLANIYGERSVRGVMFDFFRKLAADPALLEILGDGRQQKSFLYVSDCVSAMLTAWQKQRSGYDVFNVGGKEKTSVKELAEAMCGELGLEPEMRFGKEPQGWRGDVRLMLMDTRKLEALGWKARVGLRDGLRRYIGWLREGSGLKNRGRDR
ncbi:MAG: NAD-dependent epimerase/dehydratase family protein [Candidatus Micrarchaeota archaeon]